MSKADLDALFAAAARNPRSGSNQAFRGRAPKGECRSNLSARQNKARQGYRPPASHR